MIVGSVVLINNQNVVYFESYNSKMLLDSDLENKLIPQILSSAMNESITDTVLNLHSNISRYLKLTGIDRNHLTVILITISVNNRAQTHPQSETRSQNFINIQYENDLQILLHKIHHEILQLFQPQSQSQATQNMNTNGIQIIQTMLPMNIVRIRCFSILNKYIHGYKVDKCRRWFCCGRSILDETEKETKSDSDYKQLQLQLTGIDDEQKRQRLTDDDDSRSNSSMVANASHSLTINYVDPQTPDHKDDDDNDDNDDNDSNVIVSRIARNEVNHSTKTVITTTTKALGKSVDDKHRKTAQIHAGHNFSDFADLASLPTNPSLENRGSSDHNANRSSSANVVGYDYLFKLLLVGSAGSGKSKLLSVFADGRFDDNYITTIGVDFRIRTFDMDGKTIKMQIWDTAGQSRFRTITTSYYRGAHAILVMYDITERASFDEVREFLSEIESYASFAVKVILVGNKSDLAENRAVMFEEALQLAAEYDFPLIETSAKTNVNLDLVFMAAARMLLVSKRAQHMPAARHVMRSAPAHAQASVGSYGPIVGPIFNVPGREKASASISAKTAEQKEWKTARKLVDNVFADLENLFYILARLVFICQPQSCAGWWGGGWLALCFGGACLCCANFCVLILACVVYPIVIALSLVIVLPSCIFLLLVRMDKIETDTTDLAIRERQLDRETCCQRFIRFISQMIRASFMFFVLAVYPILITFVIIPKYGGIHANESYSELVVISSIGSYLCLILVLQTFGTYRGLKSFQQRRRELMLSSTTSKQSNNNHSSDVSSQFKSKYFVFNIGSLIGIVLIVVEIFQLTFFAFHVNGNADRNSNHDTNDDNKNNRFGLKNNNAMATMLKFVYVSFDFVQAHVLERYALFGLCTIGMLLLVFVFRFLYELNYYAYLRYNKKEKTKAREFYFHSFVGTIIYGHGSLKDTNKFVCKLVSIVSDTLFLVIAEKLILILLCDDKSGHMMLDNNIQCWTGNHQIYATLALILLGYYVPISSMIAPMFDEISKQKKEVEEANNNNNTDDKNESKSKSKLKQFFSFSNTVQFVKPFLSMIIVTKFFMLITSQFIGRGDNQMITIVSQSVSMIVLLVFSVIWTFNSLNMFGLTNNEPGFPFGISILRSVGFFTGLCGCLIQISLSNNNSGDQNLLLFIVFGVILVSLLMAMFLFIKYHRKFAKFNDKNRTADDGHQMLIEFVDNELRIAS